MPHRSLSRWGAPLTQGVQRFGALSALFTTLSAVLGWQSGFQSVPAYIEFWLLNTLALLTGWVLLGARSGGSDLYDRCIRLAIAATGVIVGGGLLLGALGWLTPAAFLAYLLVLLAAGVALTRPDSHGTSEADASLFRLHPILLLVPPLLVFVFCVALAHPPTEYDSLTYHLFFPARWLQDHRIFIVPTPFGDQAPAYTPADGQLFFLWLMLPFHGDLLARAGEFPFYCLAGLTLYGLARQLGAAPNQSMYAGGFFLLSRPVLEQALGAEVDVVFTAAFLAAVYFGLSAMRTGRRSDVVLFGVSIGLCTGTKVLGLTYAPLLLPALAAKTVRRQALWVLPGIVALGLPWYVRNWIVTGTPLYPVGLNIAGFTLAPGAWSRSVQTQNWAYITDFSKLPEIVRDGAFGAGLLTVWAPLAFIGLGALLRAAQWSWLGIGAALPLLIGVIYWTVLPYNGPAAARFLFPSVGLAMLLIPAAFRLPGKLPLIVHVLCGAAVAWLIALGPERFVGARYLPLYAGFVGLAVLYSSFSRPRIFSAALLFVAACAATLLLSARRCPETGCSLLTATWTDRPRMFAGWDWIEQHAHNVSIAYSGNNVPYRLLGPHLENRVYYVNIDRHIGWKYHDYERAARGRTAFTPAIRPNLPYFRESPNFREWLTNLKQMNTQYVFISRLPGIMLAEQDYARDDAGFPIEAAWTASHAEIFTPAYENEEIRIYSMRR